MKISKDRKIKFPKPSSIREKKALGRKPAQRVDSNAEPAADPFNPRPEPRPQTAAPLVSIDPLLLLPMRLEYHFVKDKIAWVNKPIDGTTSRFSGASLLGFPNLAKRAKVVDSLNVRGAQFTQPEVDRFVIQQKRDELWFRWFPDRNFAESGVASAEQDELHAYHTFMATPKAASWPDLNDDAVNQAWQTFVGNVGFYRALHLMRTGSETGNPDWADDVGRITALPSKVVLFALDGDTLTEIIEARPIPSNDGSELSDVSYSPAQLDDRKWLTGFNQAVRLGMGVKVVEKASVDIALKADWIFAIGLHAGQAKQEIERLLRDQIANGEIAFMLQDEPTNNSSSERVPYLRRENSIMEATRKATEAESKTAETGAGQLLARSLGISPALITQIINSGNADFADAQAMMKVIGPALLDGALDGKTHLQGVSEIEFIDAMAAAVVARGVLSPMRFGDGAYGIATITPVQEIQPNRKSTAPRDKVEAYMVDRLSYVKNSYKHYRIFRKVPTLSPEDPDAADKLEEILKINRVSTHLDIGGKRLSINDERRIISDAKSIISDAKSIIVRAERIIVRARLSIRDAQRTISRARSSIRDAERRIRDAKRSISDAERSISDAERSISDAERSISDAERSISDTKSINSNPEYSAIMAIDCPYVSDAEPHDPQHEPLNYLKALYAQQITLLPDPDESDTSWPLLYRLARLSITRNSDFIQWSNPNHIEMGTALQAALSKIPRVLKKPHQFNDAEFGGFVKVNKNFISALRRLRTVAKRENGTPRLESLMLEVFDLFQYRFDAWATGLAQSRLDSIRAEDREQGLFAGYYGLLGKLRTAQAGAQNDGYIQAPTSAHATAAAILRSAYLRHRENGAFAINLRSARATRALKLLDYLTKGLSLNETLGLRGERWLRNHQGSAEILTLRKKYPFSNLNRDPDEQGGQDLNFRLFDGLAFIEAGKTGLNNVSEKLHTALEDDLDALSDLVVAEAVYHRAMGATDAAAAWIDVLSGGSVPEHPSFLRTRRYGHGSDYRISLLLPQVEPRSTSSQSIRGVAEPAFAALAAQLLADFEKAKIDIKLSLSSEPKALFEREVTLMELGMTPIDWTVGGISEVRARLRNLVLREWREGKGAAVTLGQLPVIDAETYLRDQVIWVVDSSTLDKELNYQDRGDRLRRMCQRSRPLSPADLNAAATPSALLDEATEIALLEGAITQMANRALDLQKELSSVVEGPEGLIESRKLALTPLFSLSNGATHATIGALIAADPSIEHHWSTLEKALWNASWFNEPSALRVVALGDAILDPRLQEEHITALEKRLRTRLSKLNLAVEMSKQSTASTLGVARNRLAQIVSALRETLDGDALPIAPLYAQTLQTKPLIKAKNAKSVSSTLGSWSAVRKSVRMIDEAISPIAGWKAFRVDAAATDDANEDNFEPSENENPSVRHHGTFLSNNPEPSELQNFSGFVIDDWTEQVPAASQSAALAVNYDTPQNEAPNCLLLCVPPNTGGQNNWTPQSAAEMVQEAVTWMQVRALPSRDHLGEVTHLEGRNQVAYKKNGTKQTARIPRARRGSVRNHSLRQGFATIKDK